MDEAKSEFWNLIERDGDCWRWTGARDDKGYGRIYLEGKFWLAHRFSHTIHFGEIPIGMFVCHHCDNPPCVNPEHLFLGTPRDNMIDCGAKGRIRCGDRNGERHPMVKLTEADVIGIRNSVGFTQRQLSGIYGVARQTISDIRTGTNWKYLEAKTAAATSRNGRQNGSKKGS